MGTAEPHRRVDPTDLSTAVSTVHFSEEDRRAIRSIGDLVASGSSELMRPFLTRLDQILQEQRIDRGALDAARAPAILSKLVALDTEGGSAEIARNLWFTLRLIGLPPRTVVSLLSSCFQGLGEALRSAYQHDPSRLTAALAALVKLAFFHLEAAAQALGWEQGSAVRDAATGLPSRTYLLNRVAEAIAQPKLTSGATAVLVIDLEAGSEHLSRHGASFRIEMIVESAQRCQAVMRAVDVLSHLGWEVLGLMLPNLKGEGHALLAAQRLLRELSVPLSTSHGPIALRPTLGIALAPDHGDTPETLLRFAEIARIHARAKPGRYAVYDPAMARVSLDEQRVEAQLRAALDENAFHIAYQPQVDIASGAIMGVEALFRWEPTEGPALAPNAVFAIAERSGLLGRLSAWVLNTALRECGELKDLGLDLSMSVNLTPRDLQDHETPDLIEQALKTWGIAASDLVIEITESSMIQELDRVLETLGRFRALGIRVSIDDFGTGFSSLSYLKTLPIDELKIDQSFVRDMLRSERDDGIVRAIIDLGHHLELRVVAEGVEDAATADALAGYGCDALQGLHIGPPRTKQALVAWWENRA